MLIERLFRHKDYLCIAAFNHIGYRVGYVVIPMKSNMEKLCATDRNEVEDMLRVHGGITYMDRLATLSNALDAIHADELDDYRRNWVVGFDCAHAGDCVDPDGMRAALKQVGYDDVMIERYIATNGVYFMRAYEGDYIKDLQYVENELIDLVEQIEEYEIKCKLGKHCIKI